MPLPDENTPPVAVSALPRRSTILQPELLFEAPLFQLRTLPGLDDHLAVGRVGDSLVIRCTLVVLLIRHASLLSLWHSRPRLLTGSWAEIWAGSAMSPFLQ
jgi:hypothetical protein